jgi:hypothetical protein
LKRLGPPNIAAASQKLHTLSFLPVPGPVPSTEDIDDFTQLGLHRHLALVAIQVRQTQSIGKEIFLNKSMRVYYPRLLKDELSVLCQLHKRAEFVAIPALQVCIEDPSSLVLILAKSSAQVSHIQTALGRYASYFAGLEIETCSAADALETVLLSTKQSARPNIVIGLYGDYETIKQPFVLTVKLVVVVNADEAFRCDFDKVHATFQHEHLQLLLLAEKLSESDIVTGKKYLRDRAALCLDGRVTTQEAMPASTEV